MPKVNTEPEHLRPYIFLGVDLAYKNGDKEALGNCPFCSREGKFSVNIEKGLYRCLLCETGTGRGGGNIYTFFNSVWEQSKDNTSIKDKRELAKKRGLKINTLTRWGVVRSIINNQWLVPARDLDGKVESLYPYFDFYEKPRLLPCPVVGHKLFGKDRISNRIEEIWLAEGPWDAMKLSEYLPKERKAVALGAPGANVFFETWRHLFEGKDVVLAYDSDYPKIVKGKELTPTGYAGATKVGISLLSASIPPRTVSYVKWGEEGYDPSLPDGYDLRDALQSKGEEDTEKVFNRVLHRVAEAPLDWREGAERKQEQARATVPTKTCESYKQLVDSWKKALKWTSGLDTALSVMLASIASTRSVGDQLWVKVIGPASCGKSTLCEGVSVATRYVLAKSTIRGFHSGWKSEDGEDNSLIAKVSGKTLVTKDGDTLLQSPSRDQILSEARDLYDSVSRTHYRNQVQNDYAGIRMTWILCGTSGLRKIDSSELGERFLDCVIMDRIDDELEDEILIAVAKKAAKNVSIEANGSKETNYEPELASAMGMTGGYVEWVRENVFSGINEIEQSEEALRECALLGKFVAYTRARPSRLQEEKGEREFAARLVSQLSRLACCLAFVLNRPSLDHKVMSRVRKVALDTARGTTLDIVRRLYEKENGMEKRGLNILLNLKEERIDSFLRFLMEIEVIKRHNPKKGLTRYSLTPRLRALYKAVVLQEE